MSEHSPLPWSFSFAPGRIYVRDANGTIIGEFKHLNDANKAIVAVNNHDTLVEALSLAALLLGCGEPYDDFENLADLFCRETGYMRPGKSDVRGFHSDEERQQRFREWVASKKGDIAAALAALKEQP